MLERDGPSPSFSLEEATALHRLASEALANVAKHANASRIEVRLAVRDGELTLAIQDDGCGFDLEAVRSSFGIRGLHARALNAGATLLIKSRSGEGTTVTVQKLL